MIYEEHPTCEKPDSSDAKIWRYISFSKFIALVHTRTLHFTVAAKLEDKHEGTLPWENLRQMDPESVAMYDQWRARTLVNCWNLGDNQSAAMWQTYTGKGEGIAIQSTFARLARCFLDEDDRLKGEKVLIGAVKYIDFRKDTIPEVDKGNMLAPILYKNNYFAFERELRAVYMPFGVTQGSQLTLEAILQGARDGVDVKIDLETLIERIYVAPSSPDWLYHLVRSILPKSFADLVEFSPLDDLPQRFGRSRTPRKGLYAFPNIFGLDSKALEDLEDRHENESKDSSITKPNDS